MRELHLGHTCLTFLTLIGTIALTRAQNCGFDGLDFQDEMGKQFFEVKATGLGPGDWSAAVTPCREPESPLNCPFTDKLSGYVSRMNGGFCSAVISRWDSTGVWSYVNGKDRSDGVKVHFENGEPCNGVNANSDLIFVCDDGEVEASATTNDGSQSCSWTVTLPSKTVCGGGGLSGGWIFTIIVLVTFTVYIIAGVVYKTRQKGTSGVDSVPNIDFWREIPGLVKEGCGVTMEKVRGSRGYKNVDNDGGF